ncbi:MAG TPA: rhodanese-like domain-containing protein [Dissulfurispiraceae bacterium]|nr:rhodanese-like domain-containing protein [Dissulfurispiraceae bacterium]
MISLQPSLKKIRFFMLLMFVLFLVPVTQASAEMQYGNIDTARLKAMMDNKDTFVLIDARTKEEYDEAHIPGAINMPEKKFDALLSTLPADKSYLLVIYCNGVRCGKSRKVAGKATDAGYSKIILYAEGFPVWEEKGMKITAGPDYGKKIQTRMYHPAELAELMKTHKNDYVIVDVRDTSEYKEGHIPEAINIPSETFALKSEVLPKEKKIIVYCNTGSRSYMAYRKLIKLAYPDIYQALFAEWKDAGNPVEK